ncbi:protein TRACHEARY ELEMENT DIFFERENTIATION-RELATED 6-like [Andrographis paniculata]|uniref:protein TRACHEARY ELEMENT DIFFERENTIATION-RELATED 6-like n=1 Tax=Andrographis paniculata TaxID=175694 RepID=UPI0021E8CF77|nr:protein TRACHEARY ELEMENT DIFFERENTIATION-RELATED 6-like [Andrographis paniculata]
MASSSSSIVVILFISFGCIFFFALCFFGAWFLIKSKKKKTVRGTEVIRSDEHFKVKEDIVSGPGGEKAVALSVEKDKHFEDNFAETNEESKEIKTRGDIDIERGE